LFEYGAGLLFFILLFFFTYFYIKIRKNNVFNWAEERDPPGGALCVNMGPDYSPLSVRTIRGGYELWDPRAQYCHPPRYILYEYTGAHCKEILDSSSCPLMVQFMALPGREE
jgi:hypothetical protein